MSKHFIWNSQAEKYEKEDYLEDWSSNKKITVGEHFPQIGNVYFIFFKENMANSLYEDIFKNC